MEDLKYIIEILTVVFAEIGLLAVGIVVALLTTKRKCIK